MNRRQRRQDLAQLRSSGCTCEPELRPHPIDETAPPGVTSALLVQHQAGCRLGDWIVELNNQGIFPALMTTGWRCTR